MMRLIDANELGSHKFPLTPLRYHAGWNDAIDAVIENAPTIDAVPVVHGRWLVDGATGINFCSECNTDAVEAGTPFCPECGAKMEDGDEDD